MKLKSYLAGYEPFYEEIFECLTTERKSGEDLIEEAD